MLHRRGTSYWPPTAVAPNHIWMVFVDPVTGLTQDQPEYDPWGDTWKA
jgi:hypothetical protein